MAISLRYIAGFFDGEGCVTIGSTYVNGNYVGGYLAIVISNRSSEVLEQIQDRFGGSLKRRKSGVYNLKMTTATARRFLLHITPHLIIKQEVAIAGIELASFPRGNPLSPDREEVRKRIHNLNRGNNPASGPRSRFDAEDWERPIAFG